MTTSIVRFLNIILAGLLAGVSFGIWMGFNPLQLSPAIYIGQQQNMLHGLRALMISLVFTSTIITIASAFLQKNDKPVFYVLLVAALFFISCILITRLGNIPIDKKVMTWTSGSFPDNWSELRDKWWSFHIMRTIAELIALSLVAWTNVKSLLYIGTTGLS